MEKYYQNGQNADRERLFFPAQGYQPHAEKDELRHGADSVDGHPSHAAQVKKHKEGRHKSSSAFFILRLHP